MKLDVYFNNDCSMDGQAILEENLITNECKLLLKTTLFISETRTFINKAVEILKKRYDLINVVIHWDSADKKDVSEELI